MAKTDIGPKIGIEGEAQFRKELKDVNMSVKTLGSTVELVTSQFIGNEKSVEALTAKNDALGAMEVEVARKSEILYNEMQKLAAAYGEADPRTQKLTQEYNKNETQLNKLRAEQAANEEQIKKLTEAEGKNAGQTDALTGSFAQFCEGAGGVDGVLKALGINVQGLTKFFGLNKEQTAELSNAFNGGGMSLAVAGAAAAAAIALAAMAVKEITEFMADAVSSATDYADSISTLATQYHIATDKLQEYQYMAELTDTSLDTITGSISKLTRSMDKARDGNAEAAEAFAKLNIRVTDTNGELRDSSEVFEQAVGALNMIHNETERDTIAMTLFGRSAMDLNSLVQSMADGSFKQFQEEARAMGYVLSDEEITALRQLDDEFVRFDNQMTAVKNQIAAEMAPALIELAQQLLEVAQTVDWREFGKAAADMITELTPMIVDLAEAIASVGNAIISVQEALENNNMLSQYWSDVKTYGKTMLRSVPGIGGVFRAYDTVSSLYGAFSGQPAQVNINLNGQTVGSAMVPIIEGNQYLRGDIL